MARWATMIENVLKIWKDPTNSAMNANTSSAIRKKPSPSFSCSDCSSATEVLVTASTLGGQHLLDRGSRAARGRRPRRPSTEIESNSPSLSSTRCAVGNVNDASVAPPRLSASPKPTIPEIVNSSGGPWNRIFTCSPTVRS